MSARCHGSDRFFGYFTPVENDGTPLRELSSRIQKAIGRVAVVTQYGENYMTPIRGGQIHSGLIYDTDIPFSEHTS